MRFATAHKTATYLLVGFAYVAMIAGGGISPLIALAGLVGLVGSWWWEPPLVKLERWTWVWTAASLFALFYSALTAIATGDFLGVGAQFLVWLVVAKAYNRRAARDWQQLYLLSFLMLVAGSVLDPELTYGVCFLGYVIAATWALTLFHLRREMEDNLLVKHAADRASERVEVRRILDSKRIVGARFFAGTGALSTGVFLVSAAIFLALPRVGFGFFLKNRNNLAMRGFADQVKLGGHGVLKNDPTIVMRVEIDPALGSRSAPAIHWRGVAFDRYHSGTWWTSPDAPPTLDVVDSPRAGTERHTLAWSRARPIDGDAVERVATRQDIWLEPLDSDVMFGASIPRVIETAGQVRRAQRAGLKNDELRMDHSGTIHYAVWSQLVSPPPSALRAATGPLPPGYQAYLQVPLDQITPRTIALAHRIADGQRTAYDKAVAIQSWLDENLSYTLVLAEPRPGQEPLDFFLFDRKKGHCEYFASAFAILARIVGVPTREVDGFLGGEWNEHGYVAVRAGDAHAWDEVYFPGAGWVTFDPTPADRHDPLGRGDDGWTSRLSRMMDTLRFQWTKWVIEYDLVAQLELFRDVGSGLARGASTVKRAIAGIVRFWPVPAALAALAIAVAILRRRRAIGFTPAGGGGGSRGRTAISRAWDLTSRRLAKAGFPRAPGQTPRELAATVPASIADEVRELTELYYSAEWGTQTDDTSERRATELADAIRATLASPTKDRPAPS